MAAAKITAGMLVVHPAKPEWGPGKVARLDRTTVWVFWRDVEDQPIKMMSRSHVSLVPAPSQSDPQLDNLPPLTDSAGTVAQIPRQLTLQRAIERFLGRYPGGFYDPSYLGDVDSGERAYKEAAHRECVARFGEGRYAHLLSRNRPLLAEELKRTFQSVNLLSSFEKAAVTDALKDVDQAVPYLVNLGRVIASETASEDVIDPYFRAVCDLPASGSRVATWPVATLIPFLMRPDRHLFLKPSVTERAAEALCFGLNYRATPNWLTYARLLEMGRVYKEQLKDLKPRDMIDVQSFFWVACGPTDKD